MVFETAWDRRQLAACAPRGPDAFELAFSVPTDADCPADFDPRAFVSRAARGEWGRIDGVMGSGDFAGVPLAGAIAAQLGLPGVAARAAGRRRAQVPLARRAARGGSRGRAGVRALRPRARRRRAAEFPFFVKPVKGSFSVLAQPIADEAEFRAYLASPGVAEFDADYLPVFHRLVKGYAEFGTTSASCSPRGCCAATS